MEISTWIINTIGILYLLYRIFRYKESLKVSDIENFNLKESLKVSEEKNTSFQCDIINYESRIVQFQEVIEELKKNIEFLELKHQNFIENTKEPKLFFVEHNFSQEWKELFYINETAKRLKCSIAQLFQRSNFSKEIEKTKNLIQ